MICLDASVCIKWFKKGEAFEDEALRLFDMLLGFEVVGVANEWISLEIVRGLKRAQNVEGALYITNEYIHSAFSSIEDLFELTAIKRITVSQTKLLARDLQIMLNLYAADAIHLATAILTNSAVLLTHDDHLLRDEVKGFAISKGIDILKLNDIHSVIG